MLEVTSKLIFVFLSKYLNTFIISLALEFYLYYTITKYYDKNLIPIDIISYFRALNESTKLQGSNTFLFRLLA